MACSETGTSTNITLGGEYQVFLSFRGPDTRRGFTNSLYHALVDAGIRVFIDDEDLRSGERISDNLLRAIDDSKVYIPIFSKNYASSHWCLRELAKMVENTSKSEEDGNKVILPIFYDVKPDDVKLKTPLYNEAILNLEQKMENQKNKFRSEDIKNWRQALKEVGGIKGWELEEYHGHGHLTKVVVNEVVNRLKTRQRSVTKDLVGMEDQIAAIKNLLDIDSGGVRIIVIYGMGGIGKTTLSKIIFNQLCPRFGINCSFLDDVRETAKTKGLIELQKKLLSDSGGVQNIDNVDKGITTIGQTICNKKMLIVLDDVDEANQIQNLIPVNSLYSGTRILVTTRDKSVMNIRGFKYKFEDYEMVGLSNEDALKLFCRHAFNDDSSPVNYYTLSKSIVSTVDGLPLALEAIGSSLFGQENKKIWEERLKKLKKTPHKDVLGKLRISYDALEPDQQHIFLDVACFFIGVNKTNAMYVWEDCGFGPEEAIDALIKRCMIKVLDGVRFGMHDQFRDLGRAIVGEERTILGDKDDIICKLRSTEIKGSVQALRLEFLSRTPITVTSEQIKRFPHMRFLWLSEVICQGDFTSCLSELKWISLRYFYSMRPHLCQNQQLEATNLLRLKNAVVVNLWGLDITEDVFKSLIEEARNLKVLTIHYNSSIHGTPTFPEYSILEKLTIYAFSSLMEIDSSIGNLTCLTDLSLASCIALTKLPEQIGKLQNLQHLCLSNCRNLTKLPNSVSKLKSLTDLDVSNTKITRLPDSIGRLPSLSSVYASSTQIEKLPSTMSEFRQLQTLNLIDCHGIQELPKLPRSLTSLRLTSTSLLSVPDLSYLTNLVELFLTNGFDSMARSDMIQTCDLRWIGKLSKLSKLYFYFPTIRAPTIELGSLSLLKELTLYNPLGNQVQVGRQGPYRKSRENEGYQEDYIFLWPKNLEEPGCNEPQALELIDDWRGVFLFPSSLKMLKEINLSGFLDIQVIQFVSTLESLEIFRVKECSSLKRLGGLSNLNNLKDLRIIGCTSLQVVEGIDELEYLFWLEIKGCRSMEMIFDASSSKIPNKCNVSIRCSGELLDSRPFIYRDNWETYREKILNGTKQTPDSEIETRDYETETTDFETETGDSEIETTDSETETTDSETETGDPLQKTVCLLTHLIISFCRAGKMKRRKERERPSRPKNEEKERGEDFQ